MLGLRHVLYTCNSGLNLGYLLALPGPVLGHCHHYWPLLLCKTPPGELH